MPLSAGDRLGPYEIIALVGKGGMGEVYRARDSKLGRDIALKVLPDMFARDAERMARFEREARVLASLNHPNIAQIYGVEGHALVMEFVEGESPRGPLNFDDAWKIASQIATALEYAHGRGVVHRDLKPANVKVTPEGVVKLLDFGLAKALESKVAPASAGEAENSPTLTMGATQLGVILGTAAYMAPEQAKGKSVDPRADIWSFGVVLYELLAGERLFKGDDVSEILAGVIKEKPDFTKVPERARPMLQRCLQKDPKDRLRDIADLDLLLVGQAHGLSSAPPPKGLLYHLWPATAALFAILAALALWSPWRKPPGPPELTKFEIFPPEKATIGKFAVSPDGRKIAFYADGSGRAGLWVRSLDSVESQLVVAAPSGGLPTFFWSYDSRSLAFPGGSNFDTLMKVDLTGAPPQSICEIKSVVVGGSWSQDGTILFGSAAPGGVWRVSAAGGTPTPLTVTDASRQESGHYSPIFLPDGKHFVYLRASSVPENIGIYIGSVDAMPEQQGLKRLTATNFNPAIAPSADPGAVNLLFLRESALLAQALDLTKLELTGDPVRVAAGVGSQYEFGGFGASTSGALAYWKGPVQGAVAESPLVWLDRAGTNLGAAGASGYSLKLDPSAARVAVARIVGVPTSDIWLYDFARKSSTRLTSDPAEDSDPVWSPNGAFVAFASGGFGSPGLYRMPSNGSGSRETLLPPGINRDLDDWSADGHFLLYSETNPKTKSDLWILPMAPEKAGEPRKPAAYLNSEFNETEGQFSPNGHWIAYVSDESGRPEVYIQSFPLNAGGAGKVTVSTGSGLMPRWQRDGKELFFVAAGGDVMAVEVTEAPSLKIGIPKRLFNAPILNINPNYFSWDVTLDGKRFLVESPEGPEKTAPSPITVVLNWQRQTEPRQ